MTNELRRIAAGVDVSSRPVDVRRAELGEVDMLIDPRGEESLGH